MKTTPLCRENSHASIGTKLALGPMLLCAQPFYWFDIANISLCRGPIYFSIFSDAIPSPHYRFRVLASRSTLRCHYLILRYRWADCGIPLPILWVFLRYLSKLFDACLLSYRRRYYIVSLHDVNWFWTVPIHGDTGIISCRFGHIKPRHKPLPLLHITMLPRLSFTPDADAIKRYAAISLCGWTSIVAPRAGRCRISHFLYH